MDVFKFALGKDNLDGSLIEKRIDFLLQQKNQGKQVSQLYKPREAGVNKNLFRFTEEQMTFIKGILEPLLRFFNYEEFFELEKQEQEGGDFRAFNIHQFELAATFTSEFAINTNVNVRSRKYSKPEDLFDGAADRGLLNFNHLTEKVTIQDRYGT